VAHLAAIPLDGGPERVLHEVKGPALYFVSSLAFDPHTANSFSLPTTTSGATCACWTWRPAGNGS